MILKSSYRICRIVRQTIVGIHSFGHRNRWSKRHSIVITCRWWHRLFAGRIFLNCDNIAYSWLVAAVANDRLTIFVQRVKIPTAVTTVVDSGCD